MTWGRRHFFPEHSKLGFWWDPLIQTWRSMSLKSTGVICHDSEELCKIWRGTDLSFQSWHEEFDEFWPKHLKVSKIFILMGSFWTKYMLFELKKYRGVILHETKGGCKIWREIDLPFQNWHMEFDKFWPEHSNISHKVSKIFTLIGPFWAKYILSDLKKYRDVIFHATGKIWRGIDLPFLNLHKEFDKFCPGHSNVSKRFTLIGSFWARYVLFELKNYRGVIFHETEAWYKICRGIDLSFQNWHKEVDKFWPEHSKISKIFTLMSSF